METETSIVTGIGPAGRGPSEGEQNLKHPGSPLVPPVFQKSELEKSSPSDSSFGSTAHMPPAGAQVASSAANAERKRAKSSLRLKYEAETHVIERKLGDLEAIREKLGLSQRKMAQLLLVDPSAWTRWTKGGDEAPPHIYRMLQWYLALEEKYPVLDVNFWLQTVAQLPDKSGELARAQRESSQELERQLREANDRITNLEGRLEPTHLASMKKLFVFSLGLLLGAAVMWFR